MVLNWSLSDSKSIQVSKTLLSMLAYLNNIVAWMVSNCLWFISLLVPFINPFGLSQVHQLKLVSLSPSCSIVFPVIYLSFRFLLILSRDGKVHYLAGSLFCCCWLSLGQVVWPRSGDPFAFQNPREFCASHYPGRIPGCAYIICSYLQV